MALCKAPWTALIAQILPESFFLQGGGSHTDNKSDLLGRENFAPIEADPKTAEIELYSLITYIMKGDIHKAE